MNPDAFNAQQTAANASDAEFWRYLATGFVCVAAVVMATWLLLALWQRAVVWHHLRRDWLAEWPTACDGTVLCRSSEHVPGCYADAHTWEDRR